MAAKVKVKGEEFKVMVLAALQDARQKGTDKVVEVYNKIKDYIVSTRCEDMFNPDVSETPFPVCQYFTPLSLFNMTLKSKVIKIL